MLNPLDNLRLLYLQPVAVLALISVTVCLVGCAGADPGPGLPAIRPADTPAAAVPLPAPASPFLVKQADKYAPAQVFDEISGRHLWSLPPGRLSADRSTYAAVFDSPEGAVLQRYSPHERRPLATHPLRGRWELAALSADGRWAALTTAGAPLVLHQNAIRTSIRIVNTYSGRVLEPVELAGLFEVEAIDNKAATLYLIEYLDLADTDGRYRVRAFDLASSQLDPNPLRDKRFFDEVMAGYAWGTASDPKGEWLLTLYMNTTRNKAFIHALNVENRWTWCIDLPGGGEAMDLLRQYALTITPDGRHVVAANPPLGLLVEFDLAAPDVHQVVSFSPATWPDEGEMNTAAAAVEPNGKAAYFAWGADVWAYDLVANEVTGPRRFPAPVAALAPRSGGGAPLVLLADLRLLSLPAGSLAGLAPAEADQGR